MTCSNDLMLIVKKELLTRGGFLEHTQVQYRERLFLLGVTKCFEFLHSLSDIFYTSARLTNYINQRYNNYFFFKLYILLHSDNLVGFYVKCLLVAS